MDALFAYIYLLGGNNKKLNIYRGQTNDYFILNQLVAHGQHSWVTMGKGMNVTQIKDENQSFSSELLVY